MYYKLLRHTVHVVGLIMVLSDANPLQALGDYRQAVILQLPLLTSLDENQVTVEEKVCQHLN